MKDDEIKEEGNSLNYEFRMHDQRMGDFLQLIHLLLNIHGILIGGEKGSVIEQNLSQNGKKVFNCVTATVNLASKTSALNELGQAEGGTEVVKSRPEAVNSTVNTISKACKINNEDQK